MAIYRGTGGASSTTSAANTEAVIEASADAVAAAAAASVSEVNAAASAASAANTYDNFDDRYLGAKASSPATDNDGDPLVAGALYFNTADQSMYVYDGSAWNTVLATNTSVESIALTSGQTSVVFSGSVAYAAFYITGPDVDNGRLLESVDYTVDVPTKTVTLTQSYPAGTTLTSLKNVSEAGDITSANSVSYNQGGTGAVTRTVEARLSETVSVKDFGAAVGDGVTDDTAAIQAALDSGAKVVTVPSGTYISRGVTIPNGVSLIGEGKPTLKLKDSTFGSGGNFIYITGSTGFEVSGLVIDANISNQAGSVFALYATDCSEFAISNNTVKNFSYGIGVNDAIRANIQNNLLHTGKFAGVISTITDTVSTSLGLNISDNTVYNIFSDGTSSADGKGIYITGQTGATEPDYHNITDVVISGNTCRLCAVNGIQITAVNDFSVVNNNCSNNTQNTTLAAGITISENCYSGTISGNVCSNNRIGGIQLDVVTQDGRKFGLGRLSVVGNTCNNNTTAGIRIQSMPYTTISGNTCCSNVWGVLIAGGAYYTITGNSFYGNSGNGIRLAGTSAPSGEDGRNVIIASNQFVDNSDTVDATNYAIYAYQFDKVKISDNVFTSNRADLNISSSATNVYLNNNVLSSSINISQASLVKWEDDFHNRVTSFTSDGFGGEGKSTITVTSGFSLPHFGLEYLQISAGSAVTSDTTTAILDGYQGQVLKIINYNVNAITIKHNANTDNIGNADVVLSYGQMVEYTFISGGYWLQTTAKLATSL